MTLSTNFKICKSKEYQLYRVMQTQSNWSKVYRERIKILSSYKTGIIFPEMLLGLDQKSIFYVEEGKETDYIGIYIISLQEFKLLFYSNEKQSYIKCNLQDIETCEAMNNTDFLKLQAADDTTMDFDNASYLFGSKSDALKFSIKSMENNCKNLI